MSGECDLLGSVSSQQKFEVTDIKALGVPQLSDRPCYRSEVSNNCVIALGQISITGLYYS